MLKAFLPLLTIAILFQNIIPLPRSSLGTLEITSPLIMLSFAVLGVLVLRFAVKKYGFIKEENVKYFVPGVMVFGFLILLIGSMFSGFFSNILYQLNAYANPIQVSGSLGSTIAENMPGTLGEVTGKLSNSFANSAPLGFLAPYFTLWVLMILGCCVAGYKFVKTKNYLYLFIIFWVVSSIWSVFAKIRLTFLVGPAAAVAGGLFLAWVIEKAKRYRNIGYMITKRIGVVTVLAVLIVFLAVFFNLVNGYGYSNVMGPSICFPMQDSQGNTVPCLDINGDSTYNMADNQPWYQAMDFLTQTGQDNSVLSWWDFGYWFQARGNKPSVADGGNLGEYANRNNEIAEWFISDTDTWSEQELLEKYGVGYILMDYTLIGKFGAISSIATGGQNIMGFMEFRESNTYQRDGQTVFEFTSGPYAIWVPVDENGNAVGALKFMQLDGDRYFQIGYINDVCTTNGIMHVGNEEQTIGGCVAMSSLGVYLVQADAEKSIFTNLMFMDGYGLPLEKVFDNTFVKIYKVLY
jgi:asparagine N-glycosylation enzyme membrane subunit Stt3